MAKRPPAHLTPTAKKVWVRLANDPSTIALFADSDLFALEILCENYATWVLARESLVKAEVEIAKKHKQFATAGQLKAEKVRLFSLSVAVRTAEAGLRYWLIACGLTPPTRGKVVAPDAPPEDEIELSDLAADVRASLRKAVSTPPHRRRRK